MAHRIANRMALAITRCHVRDMTHSTPLHYSCGHPSIRGGAAVSTPDRHAWMALRAIGGVSCQ